ncbi:MAG: dipeptide epimerase [Coleofasciculaceae cyanobacterium SM2_1_6]|nr:dipeptide epimerase [Coleofasciculaceae cyanobacterium SM2_1_6]
MDIELQTFTVNKHFPLTISRGTTKQTTNLWLKLHHEGITGWGEASSFGMDGVRYTAESLQKELSSIATQLHNFTPWQHQSLQEDLAKPSDHNLLSNPAKAALDTALHDWLGKALGVPLWQLWGLDLEKIVPISATIGINTPAAAVARYQGWLPITGGKMLKVKLGNPQGIKADQEMLRAIRQAAPDSALMVDANGGWSLIDALFMGDWLANQGVLYIEQPLPRGQEKDLPQLFARSPLPIFADESCWTSQDILPLSDRVHGINIKLMKAGGLREVWQMIHTARSLGLQIMFGCYSDSILANTAMAQLSSLADYLDLDSHLNLVNDPFQGAELIAGRLIPTSVPGLGVTKNSSK